MEKSNAKGFIKLSDVINEVIELIDKSDIKDKEGKKSIVNALMRSGLGDDSYLRKIENSGTLFKNDERLNYKN